MAAPLHLSPVVLMKPVLVGAPRGRVQLLGGWQQEQSSLVAHTPLSILQLHKRANPGWHSSFSSGRDEPLSAATSCCFSSPSSLRGSSGHRPCHQSCCDTQKCPQSPWMPPELPVVVPGEGVPTPASLGQDQEGISLHTWLWDRQSQMWVLLPALGTCSRVCQGSCQGFLVPALTPPQSQAETSNLELRVSARVSSDREGLGLVLSCLPFDCRCREVLVL